MTANGGQPAAGDRPAAGDWTAAGAGPAAGGRRLLVATAVANYVKQPTWNRPGLVAARQQVIDLFTGLGYQHVSDLGLDPTAGQLTGQLRALCKNHVRPEDHLVVYLAGHGEILDDGGHVLLTADTDPDDIDDALPTVTLAAKMLRGTGVQRLLLMLDTCYSRHGGNEFTASVLAGMRRDWTLTDRSGLVVVTSAQPLEQAQAGAFPDLLTHAVHGYPTAGRVPATLDLGAVVEAMNRDPARPAHQRIGWDSIGLTGAVPDFLPNPRHRPGMTDIDLHLQQVTEWESHAERREVEFRRRFLVRAMGGHGPEPAWWFSGRHAALTDITAWLSEPDAATPALVVTAGPGSGKTAVLGLVSALAHPEHRRTVPVGALALPAAATPPLGSVDVTIYAQGLTHEQVLAGLAAAARVPAGTIGQLIDALAARTNGSGRPFTAIVDALDEAADPQQLLTRVLAPIITQGRGVRLLLGTRPHLLPLLAPTSGGTPVGVRLIELDAPRYADRAALTAYTVRGLLEARDDSPYLFLPPLRVRAVADAVADAAAPSFLVARITSTTLAAADDPADPTDAHWRATLPRLPGEAMRRDLDTRLGEQARRARDLLRPLAYAEGQGLPWENIWAPLASRISGRTYTDEDLFWLREHAGSYVVEAVEDGRSAYRLYHQALAEHLHADTEATGITVTAVHRAFVDVLTRIPRDPQAAPDWTRAHPYAVRHLATHAAAAGTIDNLITDAGYLVHADPDTLDRALHRVRTPGGRLICTTYRASGYRHRHAAPAARRQLLAIDAARSDAPAALREALNTGLAWSPRWATGSLIHSALHTALPGHTTRVNAIACTDVDGVPVAVTADDSGEILVWDLRAGRQRTTLTGHDRRVKALTCVQLDGVPVAAATDDDGGVLLWNLPTGQRITEPNDASQPVPATACAVIDGVPVTVVREGRRMLVRDLRTGQRITELNGPFRYSRAVACTEVDGVPVAITGGDIESRRPSRGLVRVWDLRTGQRITELTGHTRPVNVVACTEVDGIPIAITGGGDGEVRVWDLRTYRLRTALTGHTESVKSIACTRIDGVPVTITGDQYGNVLVWDLRAGHQRPTTGHTSRVNAVACTEVDGVPVAVSGDQSGDVFIWDLRTGAQRLALTGHTGRRHSYAHNHHAVDALDCVRVDGVPVAVTVDHGSNLLVWDPRTGDSRAWVKSADDEYIALATAAGTRIDGVPVAVTGGKWGGNRVWDMDPIRKRTELTGHTSTVKAVAGTEIDGVPVAVTGGSGGEVLVCDLRTGQKFTDLTGHTETVRAVACTEIDEVPVAVTGDDNGDVRVWDLRTGQQLTGLTGDGRRVNAVVCTRINGAPVAITGHDGVNDGEIRVWELPGLRLRDVITVPYPVRALAAGEPPENTLVVAAAHEVIALDVDPGRF